MRRHSLTAAVVLLLFAVLMLAKFDGPRATAARSETAKPQKAKRMLRHVVLFKFKKTATKAQVQKVVTEFAALPKKIDAIADFEMGTDNSPEKKSKGFTHGFVVTFRDEKGRDEYLPHPAHKAFVSIAGPAIEDVLVFDYWATK